MVDFVCLCSDSVTVKLVFHSLDAGDPAVSMAAEVGTHISEDNVWHMWLKVYPCEGDSPLVGSSGNSLRPLRCVFKGR